MGSVNPVVILPAAVRERADQIAKDLSASMLMGGGQFCTKPGIILVVADNDHRFIDALARGASRLRSHDARPLAA